MKRLRRILELTSSVVRQSDGRGPHIPPRREEKRKRSSAVGIMWTRTRDGGRWAMAVQAGREISRQELETLVGQGLGTSEWMTIDQERVNLFADATDDHQFIHVDPVRAAQTPFGGTIAHGLLTLSLIVPLCFDFVPKVAGTRMLLNYGFDKVRFPAPVRVGKRIRGSATLAEVVERKPGQLLMKLDVTIEIEGEPKPALTAEWLSMHVLGD